jgi:hypothetical protein
MCRRIIPGAEDEPEARDDSQGEEPRREPLCGRHGGDFAPPGRRISAHIVQKQRYEDPQGEHEKSHHKTVLIKKCKKQQSMISYYSSIKENRTLYGQFVGHHVWIN